MVSILRTAHGSAAGVLLVAETPPLDELGDSAANASTTGRGLALAKERGRPFTPGNAAATGRKPNLARLGVDLETADPKYRAAMRRASRYMQHRRRELAVAGGGHVSAGVCAMLASAARALAGSTLLNEMASELLSAGGAKNRRLAADLITKAARLGDAHRTGELTALAVHERETKARTEASSANGEMPDWLRGTPSKPAGEGAADFSGSAVSSPIGSAGASKRTNKTPASASAIDAALATCNPAGGVLVSASIAGSGAGEMSEQDRIDAEADAHDVDEGSAP